MPRRMPRRFQGNPCEMIGMLVAIVLAILVLIGGIGSGGYGLRVGGRHRL
jgi:hypothetical protein